MVAALGLAAQPLRYMDYLVRDDVRRGLFIGPHATLVNVPDAGRFALHKLAVAERRGDGATSIKARKDRRQAAALIEVLAEVQPGTLAAAAGAALRHHDRGLVKDVRRSLKRLPEAAQATLAAYFQAEGEKGHPAPRKAAGSLEIAPPSARLTYLLPKGPRSIYFRASACPRSR